MEQLLQQIADAVGSVTGWWECLRTHTRTSPYPTAPHVVHGRIVWRRGTSKVFLSVTVDPGDKWTLNYHRSTSPGNYTRRVILDGTVSGAGAAVREAMKANKENVYIRVRGENRLKDAAVFTDLVLDPKDLVDRVGLRALDTPGVYVTDKQVVRPRGFFGTTPAQGPSPVHLYVEGFGELRTVRGYRQRGVFTCQQLRWYNHSNPQNGVVVDQDYWRASGERFAAQHGRIGWLTRLSGHLVPSASQLAEFAAHRTIYIEPGETRTCHEG